MRCVLFSLFCGLCLSHLAIVDRSRAGTIVGPVYDPYSESNLYVVSPPGNWDQAEAAAVQLGGHLVTIHSAEENAFLVNTVLRDFTGQGGPNLTTTPIWIGLYDPTGIAADDGPSHAANFTWVDGSSSTYRNWHPGEPNDCYNDEYYGNILPAAYYPLGTWNDIDLNDPHVISPTWVSYGAIYGIASVPIPEPGMFTLLASALLGVGVFAVRQCRTMN
jgi:hypothetical protein